MVSAAEPRRLDVPETGAEAAAHFVRGNLGDLAGDDAAPSPRFRGGQRAADAALAAFDVTGYASRRNEVWPAHRRGASALSPYIRHGLLSLQRVWDQVAGGPSRDVSKLRDELLWQEYARHLYARLGARLGESLRYAQPMTGNDLDEPWRNSMECMRLTTEELESDGWLVNQTRMWLASQWALRGGRSWQEGEDHFFRHLLDGSRAANRLGWQWSVGTATGRPYGFSRWQVEKRAPGLCGGCAHADACPIQSRIDVDAGEAIEPRPAALGRIDASRVHAGPRHTESGGEPDAVWITAESLGDADPALAARPELPAVFVFDAPRLSRWQLSAKRLAFLVETLAELATRRPLELWRGEPGEVLAGRRLGATHTPVPGWRTLAARLDVVEIHPWPWLAWPHGRAAGSFSAWRRHLPL